MNKKPSKSRTDVEEPASSFFSRYKELIVTSIICLFLTGIYDSVNKQTEEIKRWYQIMVNIQADQRIQSVDIESLRMNLDELNKNIGQTDHTLQEHHDRIRELEYGIPLNQRSDHE
ncbi:MAG: hypothetical protein WD529_07225 [Balneolaceae bacterium]